ncbi:MAG TPA: PAS domain-containing sensor histidine kinase [Polyangiaceae bacterium]
MPPPPTRDPMHARGGALRTTRAAALSRLGLYALEHPDVGTVMAEALRVVLETLETNFAAVIERAATGDFFHRRAVAGSVVGGSVTVSGGFTNSLAVYTIRSGRTVVTRDVRSDPRFETPASLRAEGVVGGMCAVVRVPGGADDVYGVLSTFQREPREFTDDDVDFVDAVASVIGLAVVRRRAQERLRETEERFDLMAKAMVDGAMFPLDPDGSIAGWNTPAELLYGLRADEVVGRHFSCLFTEDEVQQGQPEALLRAAESAGAIEVHDSWLVRRDGPTFRASVWVFALRADVGTRGFVVATRDDTARHAAEAERARLQAQIDQERRTLQAVIDQLPAGVVINDAASGGVLYVNDAFRAIMRMPIEVPLSAAEALARFPARHEDGRLLTRDEYAGRRALGGESVRQVIECQRGDGTWCAVADTGAPIRDAEGRVVAGVGVVVDVQAQREAARERERLLDETQRAVAVRDRILAVVSHDLRSPLTAITLAAQQVARMPECDLDRARLSAGRIHHAAKRMEAILSDLVDASRLESGRFVLDVGDQDGAALVGEAADVFAEIAASRQIALHTAAEPLGAPVRCDRDRTLQVLSNLISNALKFVTPPGDVEVGCARRGVRGVFFVRDHGPGIRAEDLPRVFERYWQGEVPATQKKQGLGLGLAICREIVDAHGGRIWVESQIGRGSTFSFELPLADAGKP